VKYFKVFGPGTGIALFLLNIIAGNGASPHGAAAWADESKTVYWGRKRQSPKSKNDVSRDAGMEALYASSTQASFLYGKDESVSNR
jgi:hypothetical protein